MSLLLVAVVASVLAIGQCNKNFTVTSEVVFDLEVKNYNGNGDDISGKLVIGLFGETAPVSVLNFKTLCEGYTAPSKAKLSYRNTYCHRLVRDMLVQCGDVFGLDGRGSTSIYGEHFNDENFIISYTSGGIIGYANKGRDTNGSQFFITFGASRFFDKKHVAFGKVLKGYQYLQAINRMGPQEKNQTPKRPIRFTDCAVNEVKKYELTEKDMKTDDLEGIVTF
ncbi:peptidyl-prolyl cis-trans isomerase H [Biomphalaria pfeifferi]|uniref:Peptidyl-prolyl cis-trans isomerase n=1 Tax=Biomphalaria pfeifferi TaxID=112525 RepID=A0AAD8BP37_BIOPF|nr:peptidyl-prolyl cis-trans isomerase H [Biomphalaria pfeifferi]